MVGLKNLSRHRPVIQIQVLPFVFPLHAHKNPNFPLDSLDSIPLSFISGPPSFQNLPTCFSVVFTLILSNVWTLHGEACQKKPSLYCFFVWIQSTWYISSEMYVCRLMGKLTKQKLKLTALKWYATLSIWTTSHEHFTGFVSGLWTVTQ